MSKQYWLCCGSLCSEHKDSRGQKCREAETGHPERCRFGTAEDHGKWDRAQKESAYVSIDRDELKRLQADSEELAKLKKDADRYRVLRKVTAYRFKKIQDACITDGGDVFYFHADRFDAAIDAFMLAAQGDSHE